MQVLNKIFLFWLGDEEIKSKIITRLNDIKNTNFIFELGPKKNEHQYLYNNYITYKENFDLKKFAFCSDVWRFWKLYNEGGIYLDSRMILSISNNNIFYGYINSLKNNEVVLMKESSFYVLTGFMKFNKNNILLKDILHSYKNENIKKSSPVLLTYFLIRRKMFSTSNKKNNKNIYIKYLHCSDFDYRKSEIPMAISSTGSWHNENEGYNQQTIDLCWFPLFDFYNKKNRLLRLKVIIFRLIKLKLISIK